jgi:hypothetical protein
MELEFSHQIFAKSSNIEFHQNPSSGSTAVLSGRTDGHDENVTLRNFGKEPTKLKTHVKLIFN